MKKNFYTLLLGLVLITLCFQMTSLANKVVVKGYVTSGLGLAYANHLVTIRSDSSTSGNCFFVKYAYTNASGFYIDSLDCPAGMIRHVITNSDFYCNGSGSAFFTYRDTVSPNIARSVVERNFNYACPNISSCHANFYAYRDSLITVLFAYRFNSVSSQSTDSIVSRFWRFGDGASLSGNVVNPSHIYSQPGVYNVCLKISSASGCVDSFCLPINVVGQTQSTCHAYFITNGDSITTPNTVRFNSAGSTSSDSIINRLWKFGDGTSLGGNVVRPIHTYPQPGIYNVCLTIVSASGCRDSLCYPFSVAAPLNCHAFYSTSRDSVNNIPNTVRFNSSLSTSTDSIVSRFWNWGDGTSQGGNVIRPTHTFPQIGNYNVCLIIVSTTGCRDTFCTVVSLVNNVGSCNAQFYVAPDSLSTSPNAIRFNSGWSYSSSPIVNRLWRFGDGTTLSGNSVMPVHVYAQPGTYIACLTIISASGCRDSMCVPVIVAPQLTCRAMYTYGYDSISNVPHTIRFNSAGSVSRDSIVTRSWNWGDGSVTGGNIVSPTHTFAQAGNYNVCLTIVSVSGCRDTFCTSVYALPLNCIARFTWERIAPTPNQLNSIRFNSSLSTGISSTDSVITRNWTFGDGTSLGGNVVSPVHAYTQSGVYTVCLKTVTRRGCMDTICQLISIVNVPVRCQAIFAKEILPSNSATSFPVRLNSTASIAGFGDSIVSRKWRIDNSSFMYINQINFIHTFNQPGVHQVCLYIETRNGCRDSVCQTFSVTPNNCFAHFRWEPIAPRTVRFNSSNSSAATGDSIVSRLWNFGNGQTLSGNVMNPVQQFANAGMYTVCLKITTARGCVNQVCQTVLVRQDSTQGNNQVVLVSVMPNPATSFVNANIFSSQNNVQADVAVYDIYGVRKLGGIHILNQGMNMVNLIVATLPTGPYILRVTTTFGVQTKRFFKL